jgi:S1-C subfamily serine protease
VAKVIATDQTRMLTLLKIEASGLPVPTAAPRKQFQIGQTAIAVGRTLAGDIKMPPSVSVGIISALNRIWGKAIQTDAKISPVNYGGPLIDLEGRVQAVLVPASPRSEGETAGIEWYDSGIGFGIPLEDINAVLPRLKQGKDLKRGLLGVNMQGTDQHDGPPKVSVVAPGSAAEKAGVKPGDTIIAVDDKTVANQAQLLHLIGARYEGDKVDLKVTRGGKEQTFKGIVLLGLEASFSEPFLGILPMRDDPAPGVEVRYVYPKSPAEAAGIKPGDRIMKISRGPGPGQPAPAPNLAIVGGRNQLMTAFETITPNIEVKLELKRKEGGKTETVTAKLAEMPASVPEKLPILASAKKALVKPGQPGPKDKKDDKKEEKKDDKKEEKKDDKDDEKKPETGLLKRTTAAADHSYYIYVPKNYDPNVAHALVIWFHPPNKGKEKDIDDFTWVKWSLFCEDYNCIMLCPVSDNPNGWTPSEVEFVKEAAKAVTSAYTIDTRRVIAHGMGVGGQMALYLGFQDRDLVRGVATVGAALSANPKEKVANQPLSFYLLVGAKDPLKEAVKDSNQKLTEFKYSSIYHEIPNKGHEYMLVEDMEEMLRWIDSLDRI